MSSFSIRDILNLPEERIRSLNSKGEDQMTLQERRSFAIATPSSDDEEGNADARDTTKSSTNNLTINDFFPRKANATRCIQVKVSKLKRCRND